MIVSTYDNAGTAHQSPPRRGCRWLVLGVLAALACLFTTVSLAQADNPESKRYPKVLSHMIDAGTLRVLKQFPTEKDGLTGYIVQRGGYQTIVYSADGYLFVGPVYGPDGHNLSKRYNQKYKPAIIGHMLDSLDRQYLITQGPDTAPTLYAFIDPNCIYCHKLYRLAKPLITAGRLQVHWIMVGVLGRSSIGRSAAILAADDSAAALAKNETRFQSGVGQGGIKPMRPSKRLVGVLKHHNQAMASIGGTGTPTIVFKGQDNRWRSHVGVPSKRWLVTYAQLPNRE